MGSHLNVDKLAAAIRARRGNRGLRIVAKEIGESSPGTLSRIENGKAPDLDVFLKLCDWLGTKPQEFIDLSDRDFESDAPSTAEAVEMLLMSDRNLDPEMVEALIGMVRAAYRNK